MGKNLQDVSDKNGSEIRFWGWMRSVAGKLLPFNLRIDTLIFLIGLSQSAVH